MIEVIQKRASVSIPHFTCYICFHFSFFPFQLLASFFKSSRKENQISNKLKSFPSFYYSLSCHFLYVSTILIVLRGAYSFHHYQNTMENFHILSCYSFFHNTKRDQNEAKENFLAKKFINAENIYIKYIDGILENSRTHTSKNNDESLKAKKAWYCESFSVLLSTLILERRQKKAPRRKPCLLNEKLYAEKLPLFSLSLSTVFVFFVTHMRIQGMYGISRDLK